MVYFDNNATTPIGEGPLSVLKCALEEDWANPSAPYSLASRVRAKVEIVREKLASYFHFKPDEVTFTSGATESNNAVFANSIVSGFNQGQNPHCLISPFEHSSIMEPAKYWFKDRVLIMPTDSSGEIDIEQVESLLDQKNISLVSVMAANNETGLLLPWKEIAQICNRNGVFFHCDATQWIGKLPAEGFSVCSSFSASAHKFAGPKGTGWLMSKTPFQFLHGGSQQHGRRGGTENYPAIQSMYVAFQESVTRVKEYANRSEWRDFFEGELLKILPHARVLGHDKPRLWNTSMILLPKFENLRWIGKLEKLGFAVATGSACSTDSQYNSYLRDFMNLNSTDLRQVVRISSYEQQSLEDWKNLAVAFKQVIVELEEESKILL